MGKERRSCFDPETSFGHSCVFGCGPGNDALLKSGLRRSVKITSLHEIQGYHNRAKTTAKQPMAVVA